MTNEMFNGMFGKVAPGMCRISMAGGIAVKTSNGYKTYNMKTQRLTNCTNFVFDIGEDYFFVIPTNKVAPGDIILVGGKPKCVISTDGKTIQVINYEDSTVENILPERHVFMGNTYFYGKIVSMLGDSINGKGKMKKIASYMMMSEMFKSSDSTRGGGMSPSAIFALSALNGGGLGDMFGGIFDDDDDDDDEDDELIANADSDKEDE